MFGSGIAVLFFGFCNLLVQIDAANSKFLASTSMPSVNSGTPSASTVTPVAVTNTSAEENVEEDKMCKLSCREGNFPGPAEIARAAMCELDYCMGCPQCASVTSAALVPTNTSAEEDVEEDKMCKLSCREGNFPGPAEIARAAMCELDYCMGCPQCASVTSTALVPSEPVQEQQTTTLPVNGDTLSEHANYTTTLGVSSEAVVPFNAFASVLIGSLIFVVLH